MVLLHSDYEHDATVELDLLSDDLGLLIDEFSHDFLTVLLDLATSDHPILVKHDCGCLSHRPLG